VSLTVVDIRKNVIPVGIRCSFRNDGGKTNIQEDTNEITA